MIVTLKCGPGLRIIQFRLGTAPGEAAPVPPSCTSLQCIPPSPIEPVEARAAARAPPPQLLPLLSQRCAMPQQLRTGALRHAALTGGGSEGLRKAAPTAGLRSGRSRPRSGEPGDTRLLLPSFLPSLNQFPTNELLSVHSSRHAVDHSLPTRHTDVIRRLHQRAGPGPALPRLPTCVGPRQQ